MPVPADAQLVIEIDRNVFRYATVWKRENEIVMDRFGTCEFGMDVWQGLSAGDPIMTEDFQAALEETFEGPSSHPEGRLLRVVLPSTAGPTWLSPVRSGISRKEMADALVQEARLLDPEPTSLHVNRAGTFDYHGGSQTKEWLYVMAIRTAAQQILQRHVTEATGLKVLPMSRWLALGRITHRMVGPVEGPYLVMGLFEQHSEAVLMRDGIALDYAEMAPPAPGYAALHVLRKTGLYAADLRGTFFFGSLKPPADLAGLMAIPPKRLPLVGIAPALTPEREAALREAIACIGACL